MTHNTYIIPSLARDENGFSCGLARNYKAMQKNSYFVYLIRCADRTYYCGITTDLERRTSEHNTTRLGAKYTRSRRPVVLVYSKKYKSRSEASKEEARIKKLTKAEKEKIIFDNIA